MKLGHLDTVDIGLLIYDPHRRQRHDNVENYDALVASIREHGLITPIAIYRPPDSKPPYLILAGVNRYTACREIGYTHLPCRVFDEELTEYERGIIELHENLHRSSLSEVDRDRAIADLHELFLKVAKSKGESHTQMDTAIYAGVSQSTVSNAVNTKAKLKQYALDNPALIAGMKPAQVRRDLKRMDQILTNQKAVLKSNEIRARAAARSVITPEMEAIIADAKARQIELDNIDKEESSPTPALPASAKSEKDTTRQTEEDIAHETERLFHIIDSYQLGDFFENDLESGQFTLIEADPPYGIDLPDLRDTEYKGDFADYVEIERDVYPTFMRLLCQEMYRLATDAAYVILWHSLTYKELVNTELEMAGFSVRKHQCGIWMKGNAPGQQFQPDINLGNSVEYFTYASKGNARLMPGKKGRNCVFNFPKVNPEQKRHLTERPLSLMGEILDTFGLPRTQVLVPFAGSGVTLIAAAMRNMPAVGYDVIQNNKHGFIRHVMNMPEFKQLNLELK